MPIAGSAAAFTATAAALKAIGEVELVFVLDGRWTEGEPLNRWPALERCRRLDVDWSLSRTGVPEWDAASPVDALRFLETCLRDKGYTPWHKVLSDDTAEIAVVSCLVPGLERFSLVRYGRPVVPTGRGRQHWAVRKGRD